MQPPKQDNPEMVMESLDPIAPAILREAMDHGIWTYRKSRELDLEGHADYTMSCRSNMISDRISASLRSLVDVATADNPRLWWQYSENLRATELRYDPYFNIRVKRVKRSRGDRTANIQTARQRRMRRPIRDSLGQTLIGFPNTPETVDDGIWLTAAFDLDSFEDIIERAWIGVELSRGFIWRVNLAEPDEGILASISPVVADKIQELRTLRFG